MAVPPELRRRAATIRLVVFDVDGVLTDGSLYLSESGSETRAFHTRDGMGLILLLRGELEVGVISGKKSPALEKRMGQMGIQHVLHGRVDKLQALKELLERTGLEAGQVCFTGDDVLDLPPMAVAGLAVAVADAHPRVRRAAHWVTRERGGRGAVREVCDLILESQDRMAKVLQLLEQQSAGGPGSPDQAMDPAG